MQPSRLITLVVLGLAAVGAVVLARPEKIPQTAPPERSEASRQPLGAGGGTGASTDSVEPSVGESAGAEADVPEDAPRGYALTRMDLELGMLKVRSRLNACRDELAPPQIDVKLTIQPTGAVSGVHLPQNVRGTPAGDCVAHALRGASFPAWSAPAHVATVEWSYPVRFDAAE